MPTTNTRSSARTRRIRSENEGSAKSANGTSSKSATKKSSKSENGSGNGNSQLEKLFTDSLKDIYWAEKHLTKALPKMKKAATTNELKSAIEEHLTQTEGHVKRLEQVFDMCGKKVQAKKCDAYFGNTRSGARPPSAAADRIEGWKSRF